MDKIIKAVTAAAGAVVGWLGGWSPMLTILVVIMSLDYISGVAVAAVGRSPKSEAGGLSSKAGFIGLAKKGFILCIVLLATLLDKAIGNSTFVFQMAATFYYIANEGLSVLENASLLDVPIPEGIKKALEDLKKKGNIEGEE